MDPLDSTTTRVDRDKLGRWIDANDDVQKFLTRLEPELPEEAPDLPEGAGRRNARPFVRSKVGMPLAGWRVGVPVEYDVAECSDEVESRVERDVRVAGEAGRGGDADVVPSTAAALAAYYVLAPAEAASNLARYDGVRYGTNEAAGRGGGYGAVRDGESGQRRGFKPGGVNFHESAASARSRGFGPEVQRRVLVGTYVLGTDVTARYFDRAQRVRRAVAAEFARVFSAAAAAAARGARAAEATRSG